MAKTSILIIGASGFIGAYLTTELLAQGYSVICCVRDVNSTQGRFPEARVIACDLNKDVNVDVWQERLQGIDIVINCAGVLTGSTKQNINNIHYHAPLALFNACQQSGISRVIQLSALGVAKQQQNAYATTKLRADEALLQMSLNSIVLRPSLVYAAGSYARTSLMRALAVFPGFIPLIGDSELRFQPIHIDDLIKTVLYMIEHKEVTGVLDVVGPQAISLKDMLLALRQWLGSQSAMLVTVPHRIITALSHIGDYFSHGSINHTSRQMILQENIVDGSPLQQYIKPQTFSEGLLNTPSQVQDRWHARLYLLKPLIRFTLALFWLLSGLLALTASYDAANQILQQAGCSVVLAKHITIATSLWDILLGLALCIAYRDRGMAKWQLTTIIGYTLAATICYPQLWLDPLGAIAKNISIIMLVLVWLGMMDQR